jgi:coproporphyrinogen III oxidase-like Fe-S oxidoreductase
MRYVLHTWTQLPFSDRRNDEKEEIPEKKLEMGRWWIIKNFLLQNDFQKIEISLS